MGRRARLSARLANPEASRPPRPRRIAPAAAKWALLVLVAVAGVELVLQGFAWMAVDRRTAWRPGATERILCVGDSHTYGAGVRADEAYPAQVQTILDRAAPGVYSVVNRGVPGFNSAQVRRHLAGWITELSPTVVVVVVGTNNVWNRTDVDAPAPDWSMRLRAWALRLRIVRFIAAWRAGRAIERSALDHSGIPFGDRPAYELSGETFVDWGGEPERLATAIARRDVDDAMVAGATADYEAMATEAATRGVRLVFLGYPAGNPLFMPFSNAMRAVARRRGLAFVDATAAVRRVPRERMTWTFGMHAGPAGLAEIARDVATAILAAPVPAPPRPAATIPAS